MKNASSNRKKKKNQSFKNIKIFSFGSVFKKNENEGLHSSPCPWLWGVHTACWVNLPFSLEREDIFLRDATDTDGFPQSVRTVTCIPLGCKQRQLLARTKQINSICVGNVPSQVLRQCVQRQGAT